MKKAGRVLMMLLLGLQLLAVSAKAEISGIWEYELLFNGTARITGCMDTASSVIEIPKKIQDHLVVGMSKNVFYENAFIEEFRLEKGQNYFKIENGALMNRKGTQLIAYPSARKATLCIIPEGVEKILPYAFYNCAVLRRADFPESLTKIGAFSFYGAGIETLALPEAVDEIGECAFCYCTHLERATISCRISVIETCLFDNCERLEELQIPDGVQEIGALAFNNCISLREIRMPETMKRIGVCAFGYCTSLESIQLSGQLEAIEDLTFAACIGLREMVIPAQVKHIGNLAFNNCTGLEKVSLPASIESIAENAFANCSHVVLSAEPGSYAEVFAAESGLDVRKMGDLSDTEGNGEEAK